MTSLNVTDTRSNLAKTVDAVEHHGERVTLNRHGQPVAALISMDDLELLQALEDAYDLEQARKARAEGGQPISHEQLKAELGM